ncbi:MAG: DUF3108 domain-containing protein [Candidatus Kapaibacterium sp.]|jgi:hypothetical protein|nr:DUF3108 domain-containing protein [Candidatus Kapabacteria bacterium]
MYKSIKNIVLYVIGGLTLITGVMSLITITADDNLKKALRYVPNEAFGFGEKLNYKVGYKFITAGTGHFHIQPEPIYRNGRKCYDIRFQVKSLESLDWLYKVRDQYRTVLDVAGIFPWEFEQRIREGSYKRDAKAYFDQENKLAKVKQKEITTPEYVHDIVSAFFYVRTLDIKSFPKDTVFFLPNFVDDTTYTLGVKIRGKQTISVDAGKFKCTVIEPLVVQGGLFKSDGTILIWVSEDERKIPVKVATKIPIGYVEASLTSYSGLRGSLESKIN